MAAFGLAAPKQSYPELDAEASSRLSGVAQQGRDVLRDFLRDKDMQRLYGNRADWKTAISVAQGSLFGSNQHPLTQINRVSHYLVQTAQWIAYQSSASAPADARREMERVELAKAGQRYNLYSAAIHLLEAHPELPAKERFNLGNYREAQRRTLDKVVELRDASHASSHAAHGAKPVAGQQKLNF